jgi:putative DNA primase/helicase
MITVTAQWGLEHGWSIIPCRSDKRPMIKAWKPFQTERATQQKLAEWQSLNPPLWAMVTGAISQRFTLDFDGEAGCRTLEQLGIEPHRSTPSGGFHIDFEYPGWKIPTLNGKSKRDLGAGWPGLDIRADGGYAIFAGQTPRGEYRWCRDPAPCPLAFLPADLSKYLGLTYPPDLVSNRERVDPDRLICKALDRVAADGRNNSGLWLACQLRDNRYSESEALPFMRSYCGRVPGTNAKGELEAYTEQEALATIREAYSRPARKPWNPKILDFAPHIAPSPDKAPMAPGFTLNERGVFYRNPSGEQNWICAALQIIAWARTEQKEEWGKVLQFKDPENCAHQWVMPLSALAKDPAEFRAKLFSLGLKMSAAKNAPDLLRQYLQMTEPGVFALTVDRIGWNADTFVLPDENIGPKGGEMILFQPQREMAHRLRTAGTLEEWREGVSRYCSKNSRLMFSVSCAAAAPLLHFVGEQSGGFHLVADTTVGKTTCLMVAGSFWGGGGQTGFVGSWLTTSNALENTAEWHNHVLLCLDELKLIDPEQASKVAYSLSSGQSKGRMGRDTHAHRRVEWQLLFLSSGEIGLANHLESTSQKRLYGGQEVRFCEIPARVSERDGIFECIHQFETAKDFSEHLKASSKTCYGSACREYLRQLARIGYDQVRASVQQYQKRFADRFIPAGVAPEVARAGGRFSLVAAAGELATSFGITGWQSDEAENAAGACFAAWRAQRGGNGAWDEGQALRHVKSVLAAHGNSRFQFFKEPNDTEGTKIPNRLGFRTLTDEGDSQYLILPAMFPEVCSPYPEDLVRRALKKRGLLKGSDAEHTTIKRTLPELGRTRCYVISSAIFDGDEDANE